MTRPENYILSCIRPQTITTVSVFRLINNESSRYQMSVNDFRISGLRGTNLHWKDSGCLHKNHEFNTIIRVWGPDSNYLKNPVVKAADTSTAFPFSSTACSMLNTESREAAAIHTVDSAKCIPGL